MRKKIETTKNITMLYEARLITNEKLKTMQFKNIKISTLK